MVKTVYETSSSAIAEGPHDALSQLKSVSCCTTVRKITFDYKDCPFMWYKNIAGRFFGLVTKDACDRRTDSRTDAQMNRITTPKAALAQLRRTAKTISSTWPSC